MDAPFTCRMEPKGVLNISEASNALINATLRSRRPRSIEDLRLSRQQGPGLPQTAAAPTGLGIGEIAKVPPSGEEPWVKRELLRSPVQQGTVTTMKGGEQRAILIEKLVVWKDQPWMSRRKGWLG